MCTHVKKYEQPEYICTYIYYICTYIHICLYTVYWNTHVKEHKQLIHIYIYTYLCIYIHTHTCIHRAPRHTCKGKQMTHPYICVYIFTYMYLHTHTHTHTHIHTYIVHCDSNELTVNGRNHKCKLSKEYEWLSRYLWMLTQINLKLDKGWRRPIGCLKAQIISRKRATNYRALLRKTSHEDKISCGSSPPWNAPTHSY